MREPEFVFIVGIGRSGTSLLQNMLNAHTEICFLPENSFLRRYVASDWFDSRLRDRGAQELANELASDVAFKRLRISAGTLRETLESAQGATGAGFFSEVAKGFAAGKGACRFIGDKDPRLIEYLPMVHSDFPGARVIHIYRDPRDVVLSKTKADWSRDRSLLVNLFAGRVQWNLVRRTGSALFAARFYELAYESLISSPQDELSKLCGFLGVEYEDGMLMPGEGGRVLVADDEMSWKKESLGPVLRENAKKWQTGLSPKQIVLTETIARRMIEETDYEVSASRGALNGLEKAWIAVQSVVVSLLEPVYCWYRTWQQR